MQVYLQAKAIQLRVELAQLQVHIDRFEQAARHPILIAELQSNLGRMRELLDRVAAIAEIADARLARRASTFFREYDYLNTLLREWYLPAYFYESEAEIRLSRLVKHISDRLGVTPIQDAVVSQSRSFATHPGILSVPIFYMPFAQDESLADLPNIYHEIAHTVYQAHPQLSGDLQTVVAQHFRELAQQTAPIPQAQQEERFRTLSMCAQYWTWRKGGRLQELFCDVLAITVLGPAFVDSLVDLIRAWLFSVGIQVLEDRELDVLTGA